jgi:glyoxylase-like metal-dependent hydrolase (beta-lactamase superfamily II)
MSVKSIVPGLWQVPRIFVNAFILEGEDGLILIDTGIPGSAGKILDAVRAIGRQSDPIRRILVTHCHMDHAGSLADLEQRTGAPAFMHPEDAAMVRAGNAMRPLHASPGLFNTILGGSLALLVPRQVARAEVKHEVGDGETIPGAGGLRAIHVPGHCAGQLAFLWPQHGGVLIAADAAANVMNLGLSPMYENLDEGRRSLSKLSALDFEVACFGHGRPITGGAAAQFRRVWPPARQTTPSPA